MKNSTILLKDHTKIFKYEWLVASPVAHVVLVHGYAEHAGRYNHFASYLNKNRVSLTSYDQRGHGQSGGLSAYVDTFSQYVEDLAEIRNQIEEPVFLMGHSMGGLVAVQYALAHADKKITGLISSSALLEIDPNLSPILQFLAPIIGKIFPKMPTEKLDKTYITRDPAVLKAYMDDPLMYLGGTRARLGAEMLRAIKETKAKFAEIKLPLLVLHGEADRLTMPGGSKSLYNMASANDKTLKLYPELYHELLNEPEQKMIMQDICDWIIKRSK